jgi:hypothetical protein
MTNPHSGPGAAMKRENCVHPQAQRRKTIGNCNVHFVKKI